MTERTRNMLLKLAPAAQAVFALFIKLLDEALGEDQYIVFEGRRTVQVQEAYFSQGRSSLDEVNLLRKNAGLYLLRSEKDNYIITWTMNSKHIDGLAMDILPTNGAGDPTWDLTHYRKIFETIRSCGRKAGLECGADWPATNTDWPHYQVVG